MVLYRIEWSPSIEDVNESLWVQSYKLTLFKLNVIRETPCGYWIRPYNSSYLREKWVVKSGKKRYAYDTIQGARTNFIKRNEKRLSILKNQIETVEKSLELVKTFYKPKTK